MRVTASRELLGSTNCGRPFATELGGTSRLELTDGAPAAGSLSFQFSGWICTKWPLHVLDGACAQGLLRPSFPKTSCVCTDAACGREIRASHAQMLAQQESDTHTHTHPQTNIVVD